MERFNTICNKSIKILLVALLCITLTILSLFVFPPSFADDAVDFTLQPVPVGDTSSSLDTGLAVGTYNNNTYYIFTNYDNMYYFVSSGRSYLVTDTVIDDYYYLYGNMRRTMTTNSQIYSGINNWTYYEDYNLYLSPVVRDFGGYYTSLEYTFTDIASALSSIRDFINNSSSSTYSGERTITIQPGYVAYIETYGGTLDIIAQFPILSRFSRPLWDNAVQIAFGVYAPVSGSSFTFTNNFGSAIDWLIPASAPTNILGQSKVGGRQYTAGLPDNGSSVAIYNPAYSNLSSFDRDFGRATKAPTLTVTISNCVFVEWYKLRTDATISVQSGSAIVANSDDNFTTSVIYLPSEDETDTVVTEADCYNYDSTTNTTSAGVTMNAGGSNYGTDDTVEDANNMLDNLEQKITSLLSAPIKHITNLVNNATAFFTEIIHFFDWLPPEVRSVIVSCLALIPVIGFIKLLF